jgi:hypothetical protein
MRTKEEILNSVWDGIIDSSIGPDERGVPLEKRKIEVTESLAHLIKDGLNVEGELVIMGCKIDVIPDPYRLIIEIK